MAYERIEDLQKQIRELNARLSDENENFNSLGELCEALMKKLSEHETITNKYGAFFADIYRDCCPPVEGEKNVICHDKAKMVYDVIDTFEQIFAQTAEAKAQELNLGIQEQEKELHKKQGELEAISHEIDRKQTQLIELERQIKDTETNICYREKQKKEVETDICYRMREEQKTVPATPFIDEPVMAEYHRQKKTITQPSKSAHSSAPKETPSSQEADSTTILYKGFATPANPMKAHIYLCDANSFFDITGLHDIRRQHLQRMNREKYAQTGRPQFRLMQEGKTWKIGEQQGMTNMFSGHQLQAEKNISNHDIVIIVDLAGEKHSLMFVIG